MTDIEPRIEQLPEPLQERIEDQDLSDSEVAVVCFHGWLRGEHDGLDAGYRKDLVQAAHRILVDGVDPKDVSTGSAAVAKLEEYTGQLRNSEDDS